MVCPSMQLPASDGNYQQRQIRPKLFPDDQAANGILLAVAILGVAADSN